MKIKYITHANNLIKKKAIIKGKNKDIHISPFSKFAFYQCQDSKGAEFSFSSEIIQLSFLIITSRRVSGTGLPAIALAVLNGEKAILCADERELINFAYPRAQASRAGTRGI